MPADPRAYVLASNNDVEPGDDSSDLIESDSALHQANHGNRFHRTLLAAMALLAVAGLALIATANQKGSQNTVANDDINNKMTELAGEVSHEKGADGQMVIDGLDHVIGLPKSKNPWATIESDNTIQVNLYTLLDGDCPWNNIQVVEKTSAAECGAICDADCDCKGFSWVAEWGGRCVPKSKACKNSEVWHNIWSFYSKVGKWPQCGYTTTTTTPRVPVFKECSAWGDPHFTATFYGAKKDFMGRGVFLLASTIDQSFELQAFQVKYGYVPASAFAGFGLNIGGKLVTIVNKDVEIAGKKFTGTSDPIGIKVSTTKVDRDTVRYTSPDKMVVFESVWEEIGGPVGYYYRMSLAIDEIVLSSEGVCASGLKPEALHCDAVLFNEAQLNKLRPLNGADSVSCVSSQPKDTTPEGACKEAGVSFDKAKEKCDLLKAYPRYFYPCILDYCASKGDPLSVANAVEAEKALAKPLVPGMKPPPTPPPPNLIGCFKDTWGRDLPTKAGMTGDPQQCQAMCSSFKYFSIQAAVECWCGDEYGKYGPATGCECDKKDWKGAAFKSCVYGPK